MFNLIKHSLPGACRAAGGADAVSLINTVSSIVCVDLKKWRQSQPSKKGSHGGYCGPAVKPIALNMVTQIARGPETTKLPVSGLGGVTGWRDAAELLALGAGNVQVCTAAMTYGFKLIDELTSGLANWMDEKGHANLDNVIGKVTPNATDCQYLNLNYVAKARIDQDACIKCGRCHIVCEDTSQQTITEKFNGVRHFEVIDEEDSNSDACLPAARL